MSTAATYREAAKEHLARAQRLYEQADRGEASYFEVHYFFGLAVECHLRAYLRLKSDDFDPRHSLTELAKHSGFYDIVPPGDVDKFSATFTTLNQRWRANQRYYSEKEFLEYMTQIKAEFHKKGDRWKNLCRTIGNHALEIISLGERKWKD